MQETIISNKNNKVCPEDSYRRVLSGNASVAFSLLCRKPGKRFRFAHVMIARSRRFAFVF